jgi:hypothetical protein
MTRGYLPGALVCWLAFVAWPACATPQESSHASNGYYRYDGMTLQGGHDDPGRAPYTQWQVWFYLQSVRFSNASAYVRWGAVQGSSAEAVMKQLSLWQNFERTYGNFFGPTAWGKLTFSHPAGPIAITAGVETQEQSAFFAEADDLNRRISRVIAGILPSLENNQNSDSSSLGAGYFALVRDCLQGVVKFYDQVGRLAWQPGFLKVQLARLRDEIRSAEEAAPKITAYFPSVKLPTAKEWRSQTEYQGSDGTVETTIVEIGAAAWVRQAWSGGDGNMTGTVTVTVVPYQDIGSVEVMAPDRREPSKWTLNVRPAGRAGFLQSITNPARATSKRYFAPVDFMTNEPFLFLDFSTAGDAQDAYAFFLYHKQLGR